MLSKKYFSIIILMLATIIMLTCTAITASDVEERLKSSNIEQQTEEKKGTCIHSLTTKTMDQTTKGGNKNLITYTYKVMIYGILTDKEGNRLANKEICLFRTDNDSLTYTDTNRYGEFIFTYNIEVTVPAHNQEHTARSGGYVGFPADIILSDYSSCWEKFQWDYYQKG